MFESGNIDSIGVGCHQNITDVKKKSIDFCSKSPQFDFCYIYFIVFILSYFNTKALSAKKENRKLSLDKINIYLHIKSYKFAGLPRDRASGRMLVFQEFLQFPVENGDRGTHSDC